MANGVPTRPGLIVTGVIALAVGLGVYAVMRDDPGGVRGSALARDSGLPPAFRYDIEELKKTDPALVGYRPAGELPIPFQTPRGIAVGPKDEIVVVGDRGLVMFDAGGARLNEWPLDGEPRAVAVAPEEHTVPGRIYVGFASRVEAWGSDGKRVTGWQLPGPRPTVTSLAVTDKEVLVADAGGRVVHRFDPAGKRLGDLARRDPAQDREGLVVPSPHLDVALTADGLVRVVNPGKHRVEAYTLDGHREAFWGASGEAVDRFCGCCNPVALAVLPDGRFVTAEKGIPRVKVYSREGKFECVVAGAEVFAPGPGRLDETRADYQPEALDVAVDARGRVLVLDPAAKKVRFFEAKSPGKPAA